MPGAGGGESGQQALRFPPGSLVAGSKRATPCAVQQAGPARAPVCYGKRMIRLETELESAIREHQNPTALLVALDVPVGVGLAAGVPCVPALRDGKGAGGGRV